MIPPNCENQLQTARSRDGFSAAIETWHRWPPAGTHARPLRNRALHRTLSVPPILHFPAHRRSFYTADICACSGEVLQEDVIPRVDFSSLRRTESASLSTRRSYGTEQATSMTGSVSMLREMMRRGGTMLTDLSGRRAWAMVNDGAGGKKSGSERGALFAPPSSLSSVVGEGQTRSNPQDLSEWRRRWSWSCDLPAHVRHHPARNAFVVPTVEATEACASATARSGVRTFRKGKRHGRRQTTAPTFWRIERFAR
jgi:hypothetical protein